METTHELQKLAQPCSYMQYFQFSPKAFSELLLTQSIQLSKIVRGCYYNHYAPWGALEM